MSDINEKNHGTLTGDNHAALWSGRFAEGPDAAAVEFETSIRVDEKSVCKIWNEETKLTL